MGLLACLDHLLQQVRRLRLVPGDQTARGRVVRGLFFPGVSAASRRAFPPSPQGIKEGCLPLAGSGGPFLEVALQTFAAASSP